MSYRRAKNLDKDLIFVEYFNSEQEVRRNGGVPTDVTFENGVAVFDGSADSKLLFDDFARPVGDYSIRIRWKINSVNTAQQVIIDFRQAGGLAAPLLYLDATTSNIRFIYSDSVYINNASYSDNSSSPSLDVWYDTILITSDYLSALRLSEKYDNGSNAFIDIELLEIYNKILTQEEVSNLYNDARYVLPNLEKKEQTTETHTYANAASVSNEADAITGWHGYKLNGENDNVLESQSDVTSGSGYALHAEVIGGAAPLARMYLDLTEAQFGLSDGDLFRVTFQARHVGSGGYWLWDVGSSQTPAAGKGTIPVSATEFEEYTYSTIFDSTDTRYLTFRERENDTGGIYVDDVLVEKITVEETKTILNVNAFSGVARNLLSGDITGEALNVSDCFNSVAFPYTAFTNSSPTGFNAISDGNALHFAGTADEIDIITGNKVFVAFDLVLNSGTAPRFDITPGTSLTSRTVEGPQTAVAGSNVFEFTPLATDTCALNFRNDSTTTDYEVKNLRVKEIIPETVNTAIEIVKAGMGVRMPRFNGSTSKIDCGDYHDLTGDITMLAWVKAGSWGGSNAGGIIRNDKLVFQLDNRGSGAVKELLFTSDNATTIYSGDGSIKLQEWQLVCVTRTAAGVVNFYIDGGAVGSADQASGTPAAGTGNILIGNKSTNDRNFDGDIPDIQILEGLLTAAEISQFYSSTKHLYNK